MDTPILLFDGVCNLCNRSVQFVIRNDRAGKFRFASLQSETGQSLLQQYGLPMDRFNTLVLIDNGRAYTRSTGALRMLKLLGGWWSLAYSLIIIPPFIRNGLYNWIARNRYRWFGKNESCWLPAPELENRFLK